MTISTLNFLLALGTLALQVVTVALLGVYLLRTRYPALQDIVGQVGAYGFWIVFLTAGTAAGMTLYYDFLGFEPCPLCWWQRIFLYPQVMLFGMALWCDRYRQTVIDASIALSVFGAGVALYHHALQMLPGSGLPCPATGVSCAQRIFFELGYITYPLMAVSVFAFLAIVLLLLRIRRV